MANGHSVIATNWSLGGIRLDGLPATLPQVGEVLKLSLELPFQGFDISFDVEVEVVRTVVETGTIGAKYLELSERAYDLMSHFIDDLVRGKMATIDDTICRIDVPVTPISTKPDANPGSQVPAHRWPLKTILMSAVYIFLGVGVFSYLSFLIFSYTTRLEITSAVVSAPLVHLSMPVDGQVIPFALENGAMVKRGQRLARIVDTRIDIKISELKIQVEKNRRDLIRAQERLRIEEDRMRLYDVVKRTNLQVLRAQVEAAREALAAVDIKVERVSDLKEKGLIKRSRVESALRERGEAEARLKTAEIELEQAAATHSTSSRRHFDQRKFVADLDLLALKVEEANSSLVFASRRLEHLESQQSGRVITAPFDGRVVSVNVTPDVTVLKGNNIATLEKYAAPEITAFLNQDEIVFIGMDDRARVYLPAIGKSFDARVRKIDRNSASLMKNASHYVWSHENRKSASVALLLDVSEADRMLLRGGLPAVVIFSKRTTSGFVAGLKSVLHSSES